MKLKLTTICFYALLILTSYSCSTPIQNQNVNNSSSSNITVENRLANKDYTNRPVNLNDPKDRVKFDKQIEELNKNRELWKAQNIFNYDFECEYRGEGEPGFWKVKFKIRDNRFVPFENLEYPKPYQYEEYETIDEIFDATQNWLEEGWDVKTKYNSRYGYPVETGGFGNGTGFWKITIKQFEIIKTN